MLIVLETIQEVASDADDQKSEQLQKALIDALKTVNNEKEPKPFISFQEKPPFIFKSNTEVKIEFSLNLKLPGADEARNVDAWFLFSPEIEVVENSSYEKSFKQSSSYTPIPLANTVRYKVPLVRRHINSSGYIKIKAITPGNYKLRYKVDCDNHSEPATADQEVGIIVQE